MRLAGTSEPDHNSLMISFHCPMPTRPKVVKKWKISNKEGWKEFNREMAEMPEESMANYDTFEE